MTQDNVSRAEVLAALDNMHTAFQRDAFEAKDASLDGRLAGCLHSMRALELATTAIKSLPDATPSPGEGAEEMLDKMIRTAEAQGALGVPCGPEGRAMPMHDWLVYGLKELRAALHQKPEEESSTDSDRIIPEQD